MYLLAAYVVSVLSLAAVLGRRAWVRGRREMFLAVILSAAVRRDAVIRAGTPRDVVRQPSARGVEGIATQI